LETEEEPTSSKKLGRGGCAHGKIISIHVRVTISAARRGGHYFMFGKENALAGKGRNYLSETGEGGGADKKTRSISRDMLAVKRWGIIKYASKKEKDGSDSRAE